MGAATGQDATFWSSALGTAAGGMVAVWAAFFFWANDTFESRKIRKEDEGNARTQRVSDEKAARSQRLNDRSKEVALQILDRALTVRALARELGNSKEDDGRIANQSDWMKAHAAVLTDAELRQDLEDAAEMLDPSSGLKRYMEESYTERVWPVVTWINELVKNYVGEGHKRVERPEKYDAWKVAVADYREEQEELAALHEVHLQHEIRKAQEAQGIL